MSAWTQIHAHIEVNFGYQTEYWIRRFFEEMEDESYTLCYDPKLKGEGYEITGSEMNAVVVAEPLRNHVMRYRDRYYHANVWSITVSGSLRDRYFKETLAEWHRFAWKLAWFVTHDCRRCYDHCDGFDNTERWPGILYYNVDITGYGKGEWYHRSSVKGINNGK